MHKKISLKDAFVKNMEGAGNQHSVNTAVQPGVYAASSTAVATPDMQQHSSLYIQSSSFTAPPPKKKATFNLDASLHQRLKIAAAMHSREMVDIVQDALQAYLPALDKKVG